MAQGDRPGKKPFDPARAEQIKANIARGVKDVGAGIVKEEIFGIPGAFADLSGLAQFVTNPFTYGTSEKLQTASEDLIGDLGASALAAKAGVELSDEIFDEEGNIRPEMVGRFLAPGALYAKGAALAPGIGRLFAQATKTRGSGIEAKGSGNIEMDFSPSDLGPLPSDGNVFFREDALTESIDTAKNPKSRETITYMSPDEFLTLAERGTDSDKLAGVRELVESDTKFSSVPSLRFSHDGKGMAKVEGHEGRHRMMVLRDAGVERVPVRFESSELGEGRGIRWGSQDPDSFDFVPPQERPTRITSQDGDAVLPMFDSDIYPVLGDVRPSGPMVREAGSDKFVPLEKTVGEPGTPGPEPAAVNPLFNEVQPYSGDYSPLANVLIRSKEVLGAGKKGFTGEQMASRLKKAGIKDEEIESSGIASFMKENKTNRRPVGDYLKHYQENAPDIRMEINDKIKAGGTQRIVTLPPGRQGEGEYEELVFFDQKVRDDPDLSPAATPYNLDHFYSDTFGPIGMARVDHIDDPITGGRATIGGEYQSDLTTDLTRQARGEPTSYSDVFVELTPERIAAFKRIDERIADHPKYKTLPDINNRILDADVAVREAGVTQREKEGILQNIESRFATEYQAPETIMKDFLAITGQTNPRTNKLPTDTEKTMARFAMQDRAANASRLAVYESMPVIKADNLDDDTVASAASLGFRSLGAENNSFYTSPTSNPKLEQNKVKFIEQNQEAINNILGLPSETKLTGDAPRLKDISAEVTFNVNKGKAKAVAEVAMRTARTFSDQTNPVAPLLARSSPANPNAFLLDDLVQSSFDSTKSRMKEIRSSHEDRVNAADEVNFARKKFDDALAKKNQAQKDRRIVVKESINELADNAEEAAHYRQYKYEREGGIGGVTNLDDREFVENIVNDQVMTITRDVDTGQRIQEYKFVPNNPFKTQSSAMKYQINRAIKHAVDKGSDRYYFPHHRDIAEVEDRFGRKLRDAKRAGDKEEISAIEKQIDAFKSTYDDIPNQVIKELQKQYPDLKTGTVDPKEFGSTGNVPVIQASRPMRYIDLTPLKGKSFAVRRYKRGGPVDMRSGIGDLFRVYS